MKFPMDNVKMNEKMNEKMKNEWKNTSNGVQ